MKRLLLDIHSSVSTQPGRNLVNLPLTHKLLKRAGEGELSSHAFHIQLW
jgi:hypothetical protein